MRKSKKGFTLAETMAAVAVLMILMGIIAIPVTRLIKDYQQSKRDNMAKIIYVHAQNNLTKLLAAGRLDEIKFESTTQGMGEVIVQPSDFDITTLNGEPYDSNKLTYVTIDYPNIGYFVSDGAIDPNGKYVIEYNDNSGDVYAVFYYENGEYDNFYNPNDELLNSLRDSREARKEKEVGYYGGHIREDIREQTNKIVSDIVINNKEELKLDFVINMPVGKGREDDRIEFKIIIKGLSSGKICSIPYRTGETLPTGLTLLNDSETSVIRRYSMTLDKLNSEQSFHNQFVVGRGFYEGENLTAEISVSDLDDEEVASTSTEPKQFNSLFADLYEENGNNYADVAYVRHLQNLNNFDNTNVKDSLNAPISKLIVNQINDLDLNNSKEGEYKDVYGNREFVPINKEFVWVYQGNGYYISNITTDVTGNSGMFAEFYGKKLSDIIMINTQAKGKNAGAIAGEIKTLASEASTPVTISNCYVYLDSALYSGKDASSNLYINATNYAGGIVGTITGVNANISNSFAATTINGPSYAGGLIGYTTGNVDVTTSYSDCYLKANQTTGSVGGLAGYVGEGSTFDSCYTTGYILDKANNAAGFVPAKVASVSNSYTIFYTYGKSIKNNYALVTEASSMSNCYYENRDAINSGNKAKRVRLDNSQSEDTRDLDDLRVLANRLGENFINSSTATKSTPYRMSYLALALERYPYPTLRNIKGTNTEAPHYSMISNHYGDWYEVVDIQGQLAYFEVYSDDTAGFFTPGVSTLSEGKAIVYDGYCLIFKGTDTKGAGNPSTVTFYGNGENEDPTFDASIGGNYVEFDANDGKTYLYKILPTEIIKAKPDDGQFYQKLVVNYDDNFTYYFNPGYAKTVVTVTADIPELVSVRTPRHLYYMSKYYDAELPNVVNAIFQQEQDIDYTKYDWDEVGYSTTHNHTPIGDSSNKFISDYNGMYHKITSLSISSNTLAGLFGHTGADAKIYNLILSNNYLTIDTSRAGKISMNVTSGIGYAGSLVARNEGEIENCASDNFIINVTNSNNSTVYVGGLVGVNNGYITRTSSNIPEINVNSSSANAYVGGFAGRDSLLIKYSYALGAANVNKSGTGNVRVGGFTTTYNNISNSYCATAIETNDSSINVYAFADSVSTGSKQLVYYLNEPSKIFEYAGSLYTYQFDSLNTIGTQARFEELKNINLNGFGTVKYSYDHPSLLDIENYPFKSSIINNNGDYVHYGEWPDESTAGDIGFYYWEKENGEYHYHVISGRLNKKNKEYTNLCEDYNCRNSITDFGYGYYIRKEFNTNTNLKWGNLLNESYVTRDNNTDVSEIIANATAANLDEYDFYSFATGTNGLCPSGHGVSTLDLNVNTVQYHYDFVPLFGDSFAAGELKEYRVRNITQLQNINYNSATKNSTTIDDGSKTSSYLYVGVPGAAIKPNIKQTHNVMGGGVNFTPIAATTKLLDYERLGFMGTYDGQTYEINDINMNFGNVTDIGLFGYVTNAKLTGIVLFSPNGSGKITKSGANLVKNSGDYRACYCIGGIVGYMNANSTISNCCVSGYTITDNVEDDSKGQTHCYIGGVVGAAKANYENNSSYSTINNCQSYVKIYPNTITKGNMFNDYTYVHAGGIAGAATNVNNCYAGGIIHANTSDRSSFAGMTSRFHLAGIVAGIDISHYKATTLEEQMKVNNCYSFVEISYEGTATGTRIGTIAKVATTAELSTSEMKITNSYNLSTSYPQTPVDDKNVTARSYDQMSADSFVSTLGSAYKRVNVSEGISIELAGGKYPFPVSIKRGDSYIYYGDWPYTANRLKADKETLYLDLFTTSDNVRDFTTSCNILNYDNQGSRASMSRAPEYSFASTRSTSSDLVDVSFVDNGGSPNSYKMTLTAKDKVGSDTINLTYEGKILSIPFSVQGSLYLTATVDKEEVFEREVVEGDKANVVRYVIDLIDENKGQRISYLNPEDWIITDKAGISIESLYPDIKFIDENGVETEHPITQITSGEDASKYSLYVACKEDRTSDEERKVEFVISANIPTSTSYSVPQPETGYVASLTILPVVDNVKIQYYPYVGATTPIEGATQEPVFNTKVTSTFDYNTLSDEIKDGRTFVKWVDQNGDEFNPTEDNPIIARRSYKAYATYDCYTIRIYDLTAGASLLNNVLYKNINNNNYYKTQELGEKITKIDVPTKDRSEFMGCWTENKGVQIIDAEGNIDKTKDIFGDTDLFIEWKTNVHYINFYENDDATSPVSDKFVEFETGTDYYSDITSLPIVSVNSHYLFDGWKIKGGSDDAVLFDVDGNLQELSGYYESGIWKAPSNIMLSPRLKQKDTIITLTAGQYAKDSTKTIDGIWGVIGNTNVSIGNNTFHNPQDGYELEGYGYIEDGKNVVVIGLDQKFRKSTKYTTAEGTFNYNGLTLELVGLYKPCEAKLKLTAKFNGYLGETATVINGYKANQIVTADHGPLSSLTFDSSKSGWTLDGWYYVNGDRYYKVIDYANGSYKFVEGSGLVTGDSFTGVTSSGLTFELHAVWKKQLSVMYEYSKEINDNELLSNSTNGKYMLLSTNDPAANSAKTIYVNSKNDLASVDLGGNAIQGDGTLVVQSDGILVKPSANRVYITGNYDNYLWKFTGYDSKFQKAELQHVNTNRYLTSFLGNQSASRLESSASNFTYQKNDPSLRKGDETHYLNPSGTSASRSRVNTYLFKKITVGTVNITNAGAHTVTADDMIIYDYD